MEMRRRLAATLVAASCAALSLRAQAGPDPGVLRVVFLGTQGGPTTSAERGGIATLVVAGPEKLLFDCGRSVTTGMVRAGISPVEVTKIFLTHLHSDHVVALPELYLFPWAAQARREPLRVWGPQGTSNMMDHLRKAFAFDIHIRRDVDERFSAEGIRAIATDVRGGVVYEANGVKVTAFLVDHGPVRPALGYRVDYAEHSVVLSGDTKPTESLVKAAQGVDLLIHEVGRSKQDPALSGPPEELMPGSRQTRQQARTIADHHTDPVEAGRVFARVKPKLAVFSHFNGTSASILPLVRQTYPDRVELGEDAMVIDIGASIDVHRPTRKAQ